GILGAKSGLKHAPLRFEGIVRSQSRDAREDIDGLRPVGQTVDASASFGELLERRARKLHPPVRREQPSSVRQIVGDSQRTEDLPSGAIPGGELAVRGDVAL